MTTRVPNQPLRDAFNASGETASTICHRIGWTRHVPHANVPVAETGRLERTLGLRGHVNGNGRPIVFTSLKESVARRIAMALDVDYYALYPSEQTPAGECADCGEPLLDETQPCSSCLEALELGVAA